MITTPMTGKIVRNTLSAILAITVLVGLSFTLLQTSTAQATNLIEVAEILEHPEQYDHQAVTVTGKVTEIQSATNPQGQPVYGFILQNQAGTIKVISMGRAEVIDGEYVIVEGTFSRSRQVGRTLVDNQIKALSVRSLSRLDPDLVG
ncbi:MAG: cytochrome c maturation protein CcmE [Nitrospira sp.]|nr:cytochrome c maturation protein CcmE [Nitrospira sp.]